MPYIENGARQDIDNYISFPATPGELNYAITKLIKKYLEMKGESYQTYNDIAGALLNCYTELYRRKIAPYEDKKIEENGDVW